MNVKGDADLLMAMMSVILKSQKHQQSFFRQVTVKSMIIIALARVPTVPVR